MSAGAVGRTYVTYVHLRTSWRADDNAGTAAPGRTELSETEKRQVAAEVALALLEAMRATDLPAERLRDEDVRVTMPRRLGLSAVVGRQIDLYRDHVRQGRRLSSKEFADFLRLVMKRPDAAEVFFTMGSQLAGTKVRRVTRWVPRVIRLQIAKRRVRRALEKLFGRRLGGFVSGSFVLEVSASPFVQVDQAGDACEIITGFCQRVLHDSVGRGTVVAKQQCETRGDRTCRWAAELR